MRYKLDVGNVEYIFRWIPAGSFLMGSPKEEHGRFNDEIQHQVTLTEGFWLGETTVTQALWQAVMGDNPSRFKGKEQPVEQVSWDDVQRFLERVNLEVSDLEAVLPTEAQWEYACRAGTDTPFSFGKNITTDQVNYDGNLPYVGSAKGRYRKKTVDVRALPCNSWGLYQMHGNVWEWCHDWYGEYPKEAVVDPIGLIDGRYRVLRGGSWFVDPVVVRAAYRFGGQSVLRNVYLGFRLSRSEIKDN